MPEEELIVADEEKCLSTAPRRELCIRLCGSEEGRGGEECRLGTMGEGARREEELDLWVEGEREPLLKAAPSSQISSSMLQPGSPLVVVGSGGDGT